MDTQTLVAVVLCARLVGAGLAMIGSAGGAIGIGLVFHGCLTAIARNPEQTGTLTISMYIGMGMCELTTIFCLVISLLILFVLK